jgi:hypothetical protein
VRYLRSALKVGAVQALGLFVVFNIVVWTICLGFSIYGLVQWSGVAKLAPSKGAHLADLPNYVGVDWARTHFAEAPTMPPRRYVSYIGWRREPFQGKTINLVGPYALRATVGAADPAKPSVYFFGGSTMIGMGVDDANTIPSLVVQLGGYRASNFGETAYTAHQSLVLLIQVLQDGHRPDVVVFYDGVNEVLHKCRSELTPTSHAREAQIRSVLAAASRPDTVYGLQYMAGPLMEVARGVSDWFRRRNANRSTFFDCHTDPGKAQQIADNLLQDWDVARRLVESYGGRFIGVLQPVAFYSNTKLDHIRPTEIQRRQYEAVYPRIKEKMAGRPGLYDFTGVLDHPEYIYIDFNHVSHNGNRYVAQKLIETLVRDYKDETGSGRGVGPG